MIKRVNAAEKLFFIDFGLMEKTTGYMSGGMQRAEEHRAVVAGTAGYVSLRVHQGGTPAKCDDLEAMVSVIIPHPHRLYSYYVCLQSISLYLQAYVLLAMTSPDCALPWTGAAIKSDADCLLAKKTCDIAAHCRAQGCPQVSQ